MSPESKPTPEELYKESLARHEADIVLGGVHDALANLPSEQRRGPRRTRAPEDIAKWGDGDNEWRMMANCKGEDPDIFFPENKGEERKAQRICSDCMVQEECMEYALSSNQTFGVWGATSEKDRRRIKRTK